MTSELKDRVEELYNRHPKCSWESMIEDVSKVIKELQEREEKLVAALKLICLEERYYSEDRKSETIAKATLKELGLGE